MRQKTTMATAKQSSNKAALTSLAHKWAKGEIFTKLVWWDAGEPVKYAEVVKALQNNGLKDEVCSPIQTRAAFNRAKTKLEQEDRAIKVKGQNGDILTFQLLKWVMIDGLDEESKQIEKQWEVRREAKLFFNLADGKVTCKDKGIEKYAQSLIDSATEMKTTADISGVVKRLFKLQQGEKLISPRQAGGFYLVLKEQFPYLDKVENFLKEIKWTPGILALPGDNPTNQRQISNLVTNDNAEKIKLLRSKIDEINISSRGKDMENRLEAVKHLRMEIQGKAIYSRDSALDQLEEVDQLMEYAISRITPITEQKAKDKEEKILSEDNGPAEKDILGQRVTSISSQYNQCFKVGKEITVEEIEAKLKARGVIRSKQQIAGHCTYWADEGNSPDWDREYRIVQIDDSTFRIEKTVKKINKKNKEN